MTGCPFCSRVAIGQYEPTGSLAVVRFEPLGPRADGHMLFVPTMHVTDARADPYLTGAVFAEAAAWAQARGAQCNLITSAGPAATQTVWHLHVHYLPRAAGDGIPSPWL